MVVELEHGDGAGMWRGRVYVTCPECGQNYKLDHQVDKAGTVTPSLDCPTDGCPWHVMARLIGWK